MPLNQFWKDMTAAQAEELWKELLDVWISLVGENPQVVQGALLEAV